MSGFRLLEGKTAVITGCNRGIGKAVLETFVAHGAGVFACTRRETAAFSEFTRLLSEKHSVTIIPLYFDASNTTELKTAVKQIAASGLPVDVLVNNAAIGYNALFQMSPPGKLKEVFEINFFSPFILTQYLVKFMVRQKSGSIINISSTAGMDGNEGQSVYGASKAAMICWTKVIAAEFAKSGIRANSIAPGMTGTDMILCIPEVIRGKIPTGGVKRIGQPSDIAATALFLASDLSAHISGQLIRVDGGLP